MALTGVGMAIAATPPGEGLVDRADFRVVATLDSVHQRQAIFVIDGGKFLGSRYGDIGDAGITVAVH